MFKFIKTPAGVVQVAEGGSRHLMVKGANGGISLLGSGETFVQKPGSKPASLEEACAAYVAGHTVGPKDPSPEEAAAQFYAQAAESVVVDGKEQFLAIPVPAPAPAP